MIHHRLHRLPSITLARPRSLGYIGVGDFLTDATNVVNDVTGNSSNNTDTTDTSTDTTDTSTDTSTPVETGTGTSTPIPTGLAAVPVWVWIGGAGLAGYALYEFVLRK